MSIAALKRKTMNGNPRLAPISGSNNGSFGFSLNGTRRNIGRIGEHLAPGAMTGPQQAIASKPGAVTYPGIHGHDSHCCTNDPEVVKPSVINTRGMLSRRLNCLTGGNEYVSCNNCTNLAAGNPPYGCYNWVKKPLYSGDQGEYIEKVVKISGGNNNNNNMCNETKYDISSGLVINVPACDPSGAPLCFIPVAKPGIRTVDYSTYIQHSFMQKNCLPQSGKNANTWLLNSTKASCRPPTYPITMP
jgi:hypothetical protein